MGKPGYLYILLRADFIKRHQYIYKIGQTTRDPPHQRLWDYPYGSIFLALFKTHSAVKFEQALKHALNHSPDFIQQTDVGLEYYQGRLQTLMDVIIKLYPTYRCPNFNSSASFQPMPIDDLYLLRLNHIHYLVDYDPQYFQTILSSQYYDGTSLPLPSPPIYDSYQKARQWDLANYPDNYVIRCGSEPIRP